jgi:hypothetical protein
MILPFIQIKFQISLKASDVYAVIIKDLTDAETLLANFSRDNKSSVNQSTQGL